MQTENKFSLADTSLPKAPAEMEGCVECSKDGVRPFKSHPFVAEVIFPPWFLRGRQKNYIRITGCISTEFSGRIRKVLRSRLLTVVSYQDKLAHAHRTYFDPPKFRE